MLQLEGVHFDAQLAQQETAGAQASFGF